MSTQLIFKEQAREKLLSGAQKVAEAVISTLGPQGRNVTIQKAKGQPPIVTKDGVTVATNILTLDCPWEDTGAQIIKQAARSTAIAAGDGTTTSTLLTYELMKRGAESVSAGANPVDVKKGMESATAHVVRQVKGFASEIPVTSKMLLNIATISANNDPVVGVLVHEAIEATGADGMISIAESKTGETYVSQSKGMDLDMGFVDPAFINNPQSNNITFSNPLVFLYPKRISLLSEIQEAMIMAKRENRPLVFISDGMDGEALVTLRRNKLEAGAPVAAVKLPGFGGSQREQLEDLAIALGGTVVGLESGITPQKIELRHMGQCEAITVSRDRTIIFGAKGDKEKIEARIAQIKNFITDTESSPYEKRGLEKRVARLQGKMATIHIGAPTEMEREEKRFRIDDAVCAAKAAMEAGVVPGGGTIYYKISRQMVSTSENDSWETGYANVANSIACVYQKILQNSGETSEPHNTDEYNSSLHFGWNAKTGKIENLVESGVLDPAKVLISALENAVSAASMFLLTECSIVES